MRRRSTTSGCVLLRLIRREKRAAHLQYHPASSSCLPRSTAAADALASAATREAALRRSDSIRGRIARSRLDEDQRLEATRRDGTASSAEQTRRKCVSAELKDAERNKPCCVGRADELRADALRQQMLSWAVQQDGRAMTGGTHQQQRNGAQRDGAAARRSCASAIPSCRTSGLPRTATAERQSQRSRLGSEQRRAMLSRAWRAAWCAAAREAAAASSIA